MKVTSIDSNLELRVELSVLPNTHLKQEHPLDPPSTDALGLQRWKSLFLSWHS